MFLFFSLSCPSFSLWCQNVCKEEKDHTRARATTVRKGDNQVMKKREEREGEKKKKCVSHTYIETYRWWKLSSSFLPSCSFWRYYQLLSTKDIEDGSKMMRQINERCICTHHPPHSAPALLLTMIISSSQSMRSRSVVISTLESDGMFALACWSIDISISCLTRIHTLAAYTYIPCSVNSAKNVLVITILS